ncbi:MAG: hypothetical protein GXX96_33355 [Planctomycetaceae bacterium]|nr:hypothetical protein [Planctomycetaceae bacterium]
MAGTTCPQCDRSIPPDTIRSEGVLCPFCGWQGEPGLTTEAKTPPGDASAAPAEAIEFTWKQSVARCLLSGLLLTTMIASMVTAVFMLLGLCFGIAAGGLLGKLVPFLFVLIRFFGFSWCFFAVVGFPLQLYWTWVGRRRRMWIEGNQFHVRIGRRQGCWDLDKCYWLPCGRLLGDSRGYYFGEIQPRYVLGTSKEIVGVGFSDVAAKQWLDFFETAGIYRPPLWSWRYTALILVWATVAGAAGGFAFGGLLPMLGGPGGIWAMLAFMGCLDGLFGVLYCWAWRYMRLWDESGPYAASLLMALVYAALAVKLVLILWQVIVLNAAVGAVVGWVIARKTPRDKT